MQGVSKQPFCLSIPEQGGNYEELLLGVASLSILTNASQHTGI